VQMRVGGFEQVEGQAAWIAMILAPNTCGETLEPRCPVCCLFVPEPVAVRLVAQELGDTQKVSVNEIVSSRIATHMNVPKIEHRERDSVRVPVQVVCRNPSNHQNFAAAAGYKPRGTHHRAKCPPLLVTCRPNRRRDHSYAVVIASYYQPDL